MFTNKKWLSFFSLAILLLACGTTDTEDDQSPILEVNQIDSLVYSGGSRQFLAKFPKPVNRDEIFWRIGRSSVVKESFLLNDSGFVLEDTVWLEWNKIPNYTIDSIEVDSTTWQIDTLFIDSVSVRRGAYESKIARVFIENITPMIDTLKIGESPRIIRENMATLPAHRGERLSFTLVMNDPYQVEYIPVFNWGDNSAIEFVSQVDSLYTFEWQAPDALIDDTLMLKVGESRGGGVRE